MIDVSTYVVSVLVALSGGGLFAAVMVALAARTRQLDERDQSAQAYRALAALAHRMVSPDRREALRAGAAGIWTAWQPDSPPAIDPPPERASAYVHRLLDVLAGGPLDLSGVWVPADVRGRLRSALAGPDAVPPTWKRTATRPGAGDG
ncbi:hypothetical protein [Micromonospora inyonensis]|uniref:Uncharacterized protein n=1 Tax=Micromonospora inyonensis TaxID=47866 RepID=A0A1C6RDC8_9ACTN|nr:hypothetical protein [Micromonospora inyonensis]SCL15107.1 hypothetical protein GA0074694_1057 [Micromonospora inyonensis]